MANNEDASCPKSILPTTSIINLQRANSFSQSSHINVKFIHNMMIKFKKIYQLKAITRREVAVLPVAYHFVTVIQNETLNGRIMLFQRTQS